MKRRKGIQVGKPVQPGLETRNEAGIFAAESLGVLSVHESVRHVCKHRDIHSAGCLGFTPTPVTGCSYKDQRATPCHLMIRICH